MTPHDNFPIGALVALKAGHFISDLDRSEFIGSIIDYQNSETAVVEVKFTDTPSITPCVIINTKKLEYACNMHVSRISNKIYAQARQYVEKMDGLMRATLAGKLFKTGDLVVFDGPYSHYSIIFSITEVTQYNTLFLSPAYGLETDIHSFESRKTKEGEDCRNFRKAALSDITRVRNRMCENFEHQIEECHKEATRVRKSFTE